MIILKIIKTMLPIISFITKLVSDSFTSFLSNFTIPININIIPYGSFRIKYKIFDTKVIFDKIIFFDKKIYISPFFIPLKGKIPRIYINLANNGYIIIKNIEPLNIYNKPIDIEIQNIKLINILNKFKISNNNFQNIILNANLSVIPKKKLFDCKISNMKLINTPLGNLELHGSYINNKLTSKLNIPKWNHSMNCNGTINNNLYCNLCFSSNNSISLKKFKYNNLFITANARYKFTLETNKKRNYINGQITINNGFINNDNNTNYIENFNTNIKLNKNIINIESLSAQLTNFVHGNIKGKGILKINNKNIYSSCNISLLQSEIKNVPLFKGSVSGDILLTGNLMNNPLISGQINIKNPVIDLTPIINSSLLSTNIVNKFLNTENKEKHNNRKFVMPFATNIKINIDNVLKANGPGLTSVWQGTGQVLSVKNGTPKWNAKLLLQSGQFLISNKKLKLTSGLFESSENIPGYYKLTLIGRKKTNGKIAGIKFIQQKQNTNIEFFANPLRSNQDILSFLLFNKNSSELTSSEVYSLGIMIQNLLANKNNNIFSKMHDLLKIDSMELKKNNVGTQDEYSSINIGKKIGKWNINLEQGKSPSTSRLVIEKKLSKNWKVNVGASTKDALGAGVFWSKRY